MREVVLLVLAVVVGSLSVVSAAASSYTAVVVEYVYPPQPAMPIGRSDAIGYMKLNVNRLEQYIQWALNNQTDGTAPMIIVFPEYGLYGWPSNGTNWTRDTILPFLEPIPDPNPNPNASPCMSADPQSIPITYAVSCLAVQYGVTIVVNYGDLAQCTTPGVNGCPSDGRLQYSTAVAFSGDSGCILAKYHKCHLFGGEVWYFNAANATTPGTNCPSSSFQSDFGVEFGVLICYDIMFTAPTQGVTSYVFPTWWVNNLRPPNATVEQAEWTRQYDVTLLAANIGIEGWKSSGSGIWVSGVAVAEFVNTSPDPAQRLLMADLPIN